MRYDVTARDMKFKLEELSSIGIVAVSRKTDTVTKVVESTKFTTVDGYTWKVTFLSNLGKCSHAHIYQFIAWFKQCHYYHGKAYGRGSNHQVSYTAADDWNTVSRENRDEFGFGPFTTTVLRNGLQNSEGF